MTSQSIISEFRTAAQLNTLGFGNTISDNPLKDVITTFGNDKRLKHFIDEDVLVNLHELGDTLSDVYKINESVAALEEIIGRLENLKTDIVTRSETIIDNYVDAGNLQEGCFILEPTIRKGNRKPNTELIKRMYPEQWEQLKENYVPTITDLKFVFRKGYDAVLVPGEEKVTGYTVKLAMPEQASAGVEL